MNGDSMNFDRSIEIRTIFVVWRKRICRQETDVSIRIWYDSQYTRYLIDLVHISNYFQSGESDRTIINGTRLSWM